MNIDISKKRSTPGRPVNANPEQQSERILCAALASFSAHGFTATSLRTIAVEAGVTHGLIRHYFSNKENLFHAAADYLFGQVSEALASRPPSAQQDDPIQQMIVQIKAYVQLSARLPHLAGFLMQAGLDGGEHFDHVIEKYVRPLYETSLKPYREAVKRKLLKDMDSDFIFMIATHAATAPFAQQATRKSISGRDMSDPKLADAYADTLIRVLLEGLKL
jgi:TetR/AcrR family transcriptional regulator